MLIGNGMMAEAFQSYKSRGEILVFASGVSNSKEKDERIFNREQLLLNDAINKHPKKLIIYFSTCSIYDDTVNKTPYVLHKLKMESLIKKKCRQFYILRVSQVVGHANNKTLINYLFASILNNKKISIHKYSSRNLISIDDLFKAASYLIENKIYLNEITNIASPLSIKVMDIVKIIENETGLSLKYNLEDIGKPYEINIEKIRNLKIDFDFFHPNYYEYILHNFYKALIP
jgi:nucleoside-diphosphate-sugar epimerase